jgi:hypothetical protein
MGITKEQGSKRLQFQNAWLKACYRNYKKLQTWQQTKQPPNMIGARCRNPAIQVPRMLGHLLLTLFAIAGCVQRSTATHLLVAAHSARPYAHSAKRKIEIGGAAP